MRLQLQRFSFLTSRSARMAALATVGLAALAAAGAAQAGSNVYWSVGVAAPGIQVGVASAPPVVAAAPVFVQPLFNTYREAPAGPVRDAVVEMAVAGGVPHDKIYIYDGSKQSNRYTANVSGLFGTAQIAMSDVMFAKGADLAEVKAVVGQGETVGLPAVLGLDDHAAWTEIEELIGAPVALLSTSPERDDTIMMRDPFQG